MNQHYKDIRDKITEDPQWFDEHAVPRYCKFHPREIADIYADECALFLIACQGCGHRFRVVASRDKMNNILHQMREGKPAPTLAQLIKRKHLFYRDPPNVECCPAGPTMTSDALKVLEYWHRKILDWERDKKLELDLADA